MLKPPLNAAMLRELFSKPYGEAAPSDDQWKAVYDESVEFIDPTQTKQGIDSYINAQNALIQRCDDVCLETDNISCREGIAFIEWRLTLKIKGIEFIYPGVSRLIFGSDGRIIKHRDYFDFVGPTFAPVPLIGGAVRWIYERFVS